MQIFGRKKKKEKRLEQAPDLRSNPHHNASKRRSSQEKKQQQAPPLEDGTETTAPEAASMAMVPMLVKDLSTAANTSGDKPARALRMLFSLSEQVGNRTQMARMSGGMLVPELLAFLKRCARGSSEQYLALLVLNNISIPRENKRLIALDCGGAHVLSRLLCVDPSCHLMAIIIVNVTFADSELRKELVAPHVELIESLCFALRVASLTQEEYDVRQPLTVADEHAHYTPGELLAVVMEEDFRLRPALGELDANHYLGSHGVLIDPAQQIFPETARWCLSALKNLSRPSKDPTAANGLVKTGILILIMRFITIASTVDSENTYENTNHGPESLHHFDNAPTRWHSNSIQDSALYVVMNLAATKASRDYLRELNTINLLTCITDYNKPMRRELYGELTDEQRQLEFQRLKARMALAYLVGSEGHFGQPRRRSVSNVYADSNLDDSVIIVTKSEVLALIELLANTLKQRSKDGPGGYSASTFNVKWVLYAIRCLATHHLNQIQYTNTAGVQLNVLLMKVLALHAIQNSATIDADAAEYASFTLYLLSNHGFSNPFLPGAFGSDDKIAGTGSVSAKVLTSYIHMENITPAGKHAADQLLLRLRYLSFSGSMSDLDDYTFDSNLLAATDEIIVEKRKNGARPSRDVFDRPILRSRAPKRGMHQAQWANGAAVSAYPSALIAAQTLSFGSTKVRHLDAIDDVQIANNIANSANGEKTESYDYWWAWQDSNTGDIKKKLSSQLSGDSPLFRFPSQAQDSCASDPFSFLGCGNFCGADTSVKWPTDDSE